MIGGTLVFDKSNKVFSYFLKAVQIVNSRDTPILRKGKKGSDFDSLMADFLGVEYDENDGSERSVYNKSNFARYYGFIGSVLVDGEEALCATARGLALLPCIEDLGLNVDSALRYRIDPKCREKAFRLFLDSLLFDSFGRCNSGAVTSSSDVDPPCVMLKALAELGSADKYELCYLIHGLNLKKFGNFAEGIEKIKHQKGRFDYKKLMADWKLQTIASDFKLAGILADPGIGLLKVVGADTYALGDALTVDMVSKLAAMDPYYAPLSLVVSCENARFADDWVIASPLGGVALSERGERVFSIGCNGVDADKFLSQDGMLSECISAALVNHRKQVYLRVKAPDKVSYETLWGDAIVMHNRINDPNDPYHGWSKNGWANDKVYDSTFGSNKSHIRDEGKVKCSVVAGEVKLPANLNIIWEK